MKERANILVVEDNDDDALLVHRTLSKVGLPNPPQRVNGGASALCYLSGIGPYADRDKYPMPDLVLLDLKMPGTDGFEVLNWIRSQPGLSGLRVVVLTSSDAIRDVNLAYKMGANSFLVKPLDFENAEALLATLKSQHICAEVV